MTTTEWIYENIWLFIGILVFVIIFMLIVWGMTRQITRRAEARAMVDSKKLAVIGAENRIHMIKQIQSLLPEDSGVDDIRQKLSGVTKQLATRTVEAELRTQMLEAEAELKRLDAVIGRIEAQEKVLLK
ncbi:MAG: hypothetical protein CVT48_03540 [Thermoplasmata archaeon HGW-Thermoplasmata-1]|nr:MAG: hypothetical protein CVT48_03540 [Thermoplasmata archaeon HGW-Thermoplasmata-1]